MFCNKCGNQLPDGAAFCTKCGAPSKRNENPLLQQNGKQTDQQQSVGAAFPQNSAVPPELKQGGYAPPMFPQQHGIRTLDNRRSFQLSEMVFRRAVKRRS